MNNIRSTYSRILIITAELLFLLFFALKPYYLKPSGSIGAADMCLAASGLLLAADAVMRLWSYTRSERSGSMTFQNDKLIEKPIADSKLSSVMRFMKKDIPLYLFLTGVIAVNGWYTHTTGSHEFTKFSIYWIYNVFAIWIFQYIHVVAGGFSIVSYTTEAANAKDEETGQSARKEKVVGLIAPLGTGKTINTENDLCSGSSYHKWHLSTILLDKALAAVLAADILIQLAVYITGKGRIFYEWWGGTRYMGTFNDPNQLAVFVFMAFLLLFEIMTKISTSENAGYAHKDSGSDESEPKTVQNHRIIYNKLNIIEKRVNNKTIYCIILWILYIISFVLILASKSTGVMLGMLVFSALFAAVYIVRLAVRMNIDRRVLTAGLLCLAAAAAAGLYLIWPLADFDVTVMEYNMLTRIQEKIWKLTHGGISGILFDRGMDRMTAFPQYLLFGAGEGGFDRFPYGGQINELHSTFFSIWFCYGLIPFVLIMYWLVRKLKDCSIYMLCAAAALIAESMILINYRQPMFWMVLLCGAVLNGRHGQQ